MYNIQYIGKSESFNIRLNNHRKDKKPNTIEACKRFNNDGHKFSKHGKFIINSYEIQTLRTLKVRQRDREKFLIKKPKTLTPYGLNQELN